MGYVLRRPCDRGSERLIRHKTEGRNRHTRLVERPLGCANEWREFGAPDLDFAPKRRGDQREFLRQAVVKVAGESSAFVSHCCFRRLGPVTVDLACNSDQEHRCTRKSKHVPCVEPLGVQRRKREVVQAGGRRQGRAGGKPQHEVVTSPMESFEKSEGRGDIQTQRNDLDARRKRVTGDERPAGLLRRQRGVDRRRKRPAAAMNAGTEIAAVMARLVRVIPEADCTQRGVAT